MSLIDELGAALAETLRALETHLDDEARVSGVDRDYLCPCATGEVTRARDVLSKARIPILLNPRAARHYRRTP
jgi:hypothetical protein